MAPLKRTHPVPVAGLVMAAVLLLLAIAGAGCGTSNPHPPGSFDRGVFYAEKGNGIEAVAAFESFVRRNPTDSLAAEAQYLKAMTYMEMKEFPLAAVEFQILRKDYPTSDRVEEAFFQEGLAYLGQVGRIQRDITGAYEARLHFLKFMQTYPQSPRIPEARKVMQDISDLMVDKRLEQVRVFRQLNRHQAVAATLDGVLADEAGSSRLDEVLWVRAQTAGKLEKPEERREFLRRLVNEFPESPYAERARSALKRDGDSGAGGEETEGP